MTETDAEKRLVGYARVLTRTVVAATAAHSWRGRRKAYASPDYRRELAEAVGFDAAGSFVLPCQLRLDLAAFAGLALSSSHAAGVIGRFGIDGARSALREPEMPHHVREDDVLFGYLFQCFTTRRRIQESICQATSRN